MTAQRRSQSDLPLSTLKERLHYAPETGVFTMLVSAGKKVKGAEAGYLNDQGYRLIFIAGKYYLAHRLAWYYVTGDWPSGEIDHKNRVPSDNRFENLRPCNRSQNEANSFRPKNATGYRGVFSRYRNFYAAIKKDGIRTYMGPFATAEQAGAAYQDAALRLHGEFAFVEPPKPAHQLSILDVEPAAARLPHPTISISEPEERK